MLYVFCSRVKGCEMIYRFRFGEIFFKLVSIEKNVVREIEKCRNGGEEEYCICWVKECGKGWEKG